MLLKIWDLQLKNEKTSSEWPTPIELFLTSDFKFSSITAIITSMEKQTPIDRLNYSGDLSPVVDRLCEAYGVGKPIGFSLIEVGYEDCNVVVDTPDKKYLAKIFSKVRSPEDISRYGTIMQKVVDAGVNHPALKKTADGNAIYIDPQSGGLSLVLMDFIKGQTFLSLNRAPSDEELKAILEQAAKINSIDYHPPYLFDSWAIPNIKVMYDRVKQLIAPDDLKLVEQAMVRYAEIPVDKLPQCFVHGDFTKANIIKGDDGKIYILDFSVANWYPRIQELAVIVANLLHSEKSSDLSLRDKSEIVTREYSELNPLTEEERQHLYPYSLAGAAMEFMGSHQERYINGNDTEETEYWLNLGRQGLRRELLA